MNNALKKISKSFGRLQKRVFGQRKIEAILGRADGQVAAGDGIVYATLKTGEVITVSNAKVPNRPYMKVWIGHDDYNPSTMQVLSERFVYGRPLMGSLPLHAKKHQWPGEDTVWVNGNQFMPLLAMPGSTAFSVKLYGATIKWIDGTKYVNILTQEVDLESLIPTDGAIYALLQVDDMGTLTAKAGAQVEAPELLGLVDIPLPDTGQLETWSVRLYVGMDRVHKDNQINDFVDLRWGRGGSGGGGGMWGAITGALSDQADLQDALNNKANELWPDVLSILATDAGGHVRSNPDIVYDDLNRAIVIGGVVPSFTNVPGMQAVSNGGSATRFRAILFNDTITSGPGITTARSRGTLASPTKVTANTLLGQWAVNGTYDSTGVFAASNAYIRAVADADWSSTSRPVRWEIYVTPSGSTTPTLVMTIGADGKVTLGTGGINIPSGKTYDINGSPHTHTPAEIGALSSVGWVPYTAVVPTRIASDDPTYTIRFSGVDLRSMLREGMPIKWTQNSIVRFGFISSDPTYVSGNTDMTIKTRLDSSSPNYDVLDTSTYAISNFNFALPKIFPYDFPVLAQYWTISLSNTSLYQVAASAGIIYNPGSVGLTIPIGAFDLHGSLVVWITWTDTGAKRVSVVGGLGAGTGSIENDLKFYFLAHSEGIIANGGYDLHKEIRLASKTTYYAAALCGTGGLTGLQVGINGTTSPTAIRAISRYL